MTLSSSEVNIGTAYSCWNGVFKVNTEFQDGCTLKVELLNLGGASPLALRIGAVDQYGNYTSIGTYREMIRAIEPCMVGDQAAIRFNVAEMTLHLRRRFASVDDLRRAAGEAHCRGAACPEIVSEYGRQPVEFYAIAVFRSAGARDAVYCTILGDGLLGAVHAQCVAETGINRHAICMLLGVAHMQTTTIGRFCCDPRPSRKDQVTGEQHLPHDPFWIQKLTTYSDTRKRERDPDSPEGL